ncbi:hypothetical protein GJ654_15915 [Rhodoblastus acidophilus]|uniref:Uncharacterized protein n=1 Tax=Rhodoblastus acidophilus TaxID=1074 RepID=A0A6N8DPG1_RHOAC|nr:TorF family putative porin [Rhodoblastus acidophilus]MCW2275882.1 uncharacterized protein (TIGR02001 family) [Rhodoblastus acidophilus]MTV32472.1 hypothetical protein [Rhodoblastus acidophilus]
MNKISIAAAVLAISAGSAFAGDLPSSKSAPIAPVITVSPWDFNIGATLTSDYLFRGITQSNHQPSVWGRAELRYNLDPSWQLYIGTSAESIKFTNNVFPVGSPAAEIDGMGGVRGTFGSFAFDVGAIVYGYVDSPIGLTGVAGGAPAGLAPRNPTFVEAYFKPTYAVNDSLTLGLNFFATPSYLNTGADGEYLSGTVKYIMPGSLSAFAISGEYGYQWLGNVDGVYRNNNFAPFYTYVGNPVTGKLPSYAYWNAGVSYTWKFATLDLRYYGTSLSSTQAYTLTGIPDNCSAVACSNSSTYANQRFVATLSFDLSSKDLK